MKNGQPRESADLISTVRFPVVICLIYSTLGASGFPFKRLAKDLFKNLPTWRRRTVNSPK